MANDVIAELRRRITDPEELAKFEYFHRLYQRRLTKLGSDAGVPAMMQATMACWRKAFSAEWPQTKATTSGLQAPSGVK